LLLLRRFLRFVGRSRLSARQDALRQLPQKRRQVVGLSGAAVDAAVAIAAAGAALDALPDALELTE
jgi:hypothetical protein